MKLTAILILFFLCFFAFCAQGKTVTNFLGEEEYRQIFGDFFLKPNENIPTEDFDEACFLTIERYKKFIRTYPKSELVAEAKLRIAEFYSAVGQTWKAKIFLGDIIKNYPQKDYFAIKLDYSHTDDLEVFYREFDLVLNGKIAAWALYYRGIWFHQKSDLQTILIKYKDSEEVVKLAFIALGRKIPEEKKELLLYRDREAVLAHKYILGFLTGTCV